MKKILTALALVTLGLTACNNNIGFGSYSFHCVHIQMYGQDEPTHLYVHSWKDDDGGIELKTNYGTIILGDGTYMLYDNDVCPICGHHVEVR